MKAIRIWWHTSRRDYHSKMFNRARLIGFEYEANKHLVLFFHHRNKALLAND